MGCERQAPVWPGGSFPAEGPGAPLFGLALRPALRGRCAEGPPFPRATLDVEVTVSGRVPGEPARRSEDGAGSPPTRPGRPPSPLQEPGPPVGRRTNTEGEGIGRRDPDQGFGGPVHLLLPLVLFPGPRRPRVERGLVHVAARVPGPPLARVPRPLLPLLLRVRALLRRLLGPGGERERAAGQGRVARVEAVAVAAAAGQRPRRARRRRAAVPGASRAEPAAPLARAGRAARRTWAVDAGAEDGLGFFAAAGCRRGSSGTPVPAPEHARSPATPPPPRAAAPRRVPVG